MWSGDPAALSGSDRALVEREPALPALRVMLDDDLLSAWLTERTGTPWRVRRSSLRLKPQTSCVLAAAVSPAAPQPDSATSSTTLLVTGYAPRARQKLEKTAAKAAPGVLWAFDPDLRMLAATVTADRDLPGLGAVADAAERARVLRKLLGGAVDAADLEVTTLSYRPHRRWVGVVGAERPLLVRALRLPDLSRALGSARALDSSSLPVSRLRGRSWRLGLVVLDFQRGCTLDLRSSDGLLAAAGTALGALHAHPSTLPAWGVTDTLTAVRKSLRQVRHLVPDEDLRTRRLAADLGVLLMSTLADPAQPATLHGDFSLDQVVGDHDGRPHLIDLDRAARGPAAHDLGSLYAEAAVRAGGSPARTDRMLAAVLAGYPLPVSPAGLRAHAAAHLLRRAPEGFRGCHADWPARVTRTLDEAERLLDDPTALDHLARR